MTMEGDDRGGEGLLAGIEAGGTKFVVGVSKRGALPSARIKFETRDPETTLSQVANWLRAKGRLQCIGVASFGPLDFDPASDTWGYILDTPKPGWANFNLAGRLASEFGVPVGFDTDVNGAAIAEHRYGAGKEKSSLAYVTIGTGIGGGVIVDGTVLQGASHPEIGHLYPRRGPRDWQFKGSCPYHGDCLEGLASGPAIESRWGANLSVLPENHIAHSVVADYLAQLCHTLFAVTSTETIVLGGGVMATPGLLERVRYRANAISGNYFPGRTKQTIVAPSLGTDSGLIGAIELGRRAAADVPPHEGPFLSEPDYSGGA